MSSSCAVGIQQQDEDEVGVTLLAMAEHFRTMVPPRYKTAIKCVRACLQTTLSLGITAYAHIAIGKLCFFYTENIDLAKYHLEQAYNFTKEFGEPYLPRRLEVACLLAEVYIQMKMFDAAKHLLREESGHSRAFLVLHARILLLYAEVYALSDDWRNAGDICNAGVTIYSQVGNLEIECFFRLTYAMIISMDLSRGDELMQCILKMAEKLTALGEQPAGDCTKALCFAIQMCYFLSTGMAKSAKNCLRQLQILVSSMHSNQDGEVMQGQLPIFNWLDKETLTALTYVFTVLQSVQLCQLERAYKYHEIGVKHIAELRNTMSQRNWPLVRRGSQDLLNAFEIILNENLAMIQIMLSRPLEVVDVLARMVNKMRQSGELFGRFEPQAHALLGIYCWLLRMPDDADRHFQASIKKSHDIEFRTVVNLSLAIVYLLTCRETEFYNIFERITPSTLQSSSPLLKASAHFVHALHSYLHSRFQESRSHLTDSVTIVRDEGLPRIQALATLLSAKLAGFEAPDMLCAANDWAIKSNDQSLILWSSHMVYDFQARFGNVEQAQSIKANLEQAEALLRQNTQAALNSEPHRILKRMVAEGVFSSMKEVNAA